MGLLDVPLSWAGSEMVDWALDTDAGPRTVLHSARERNPMPGARRYIYLRVHAVYIAGSGYQETYLSRSTCGTQVDIGIYTNV